MKDLLFADYDPNAQISISELKAIFEKLEIPATKALLVARYLIEPPMNGEVMLNE